MFFRGGDKIFLRRINLRFSQWVDFFVGIKKFSCDVSSRELIKFPEGLRTI